MKGLALTILLSLVTISTTILSRRNVPRHGQPTTHVKLRAKNIRNDSATRGEEAQRTHAASRNNDSWCNDRFPADLPCSRVCYEVRGR
jgi:hypothetical protein